MSNKDINVVPNGKYDTYLSVEWCPEKRHYTSMYYSVIETDKGMIKVGKPSVSKEVALTNAKLIVARATEKYNKNVVRVN